MSRGKRRRRKWNKKQYDIAKTKPECTCQAERFGNKHLASCAAYDGPYNAKGNAKGTYTGATWNTSTYYCNKEHWRTEVQLLEDKVIYASAWADRPKFGGSWDDAPADDLDYGFYLDDLWTSNRITASPGIELPVAARNPRIIHYPCVDQHAPGDIKSFKAMMEWILEQIDEGKKVDVGCIGGHGRTGLVLSCLLVTQGMGPWDAMEKIRSEYCTEAVESYTQEDFIGKFWSLLNDGIRPPANPNKKTYTKYVKQTYDYTKDEHTPQKPLMKECSECGNAVWYLDTHRSICNGHPTDEELEKYQAATATSAIKEPMQLKVCNRDGCNLSTVNQTMHDKVAHKEEYLAELEATEEEVASIVDELPEGDLAVVNQDAEDYQEWLRLNTIANHRLGVDGDDWKEYDHWEAEAYDKRIAEVDEQCPYGSCRYPLECEPTEQGGCFRQLVDDETRPPAPEEAKGWAGDL